MGRLGTRGPSIRRVLLAAIVLSLLVLPFVDSSKAAGETGEADLGIDAEVGIDNGMAGETGTDALSEAVAVDGGGWVGAG